MSPLANETQNACSKKSMQKAGQRQRICFESNVHVLTILNRSEFSKEEVQAAWYSCGELEDFKATLRTAISSNIEGSSCDGEGLEAIDESTERRTRVHDSRFAVFFEQECQWEDEDDIIDPEYIADLYFEYASYSQFLAQERAAALAKHVQEIKSPNPQMINVMNPDVCCSNNLVSSMKKRRSSSSLVDILSPFSTQGEGAIGYIDMALSIVR